MANNNETTPDPDDDQLLDSSPTPEQTRDNGNSGLMEFFMDSEVNNERIIYNGTIQSLDSSPPRMDNHVASSETMIYSIVTSMNNKKNEVLHAHGYFPKSKRISHLEIIWK